MDPQAAYDNWLEAEGDAQARREYREAYNQWRAKGGYPALRAPSTPRLEPVEVDRIPNDDVDGQDAARGILAVNPKPEGSEEWHAWALGYDYAISTTGDYENPLSGEWADQMTPHQLHAQLSAQLGYELGDAAYDEVDDAFELGYLTWVAGWRV